MKALLTLLLLVNSLGAEPFLEDFQGHWQDKSPFRSPTERFLEKHPYQTVHATLVNQNIILKQKPFYDNVIKQEERGFMGYHASGHKFRVFQDIIRMTLEEVLGLEFKRDFYFFRVPGDPEVHDYPHAWDFLRQYPIVNDNVPEQRNQLISANFTLFNNFDQKYENSSVFFERALSFNPPPFEEKIDFLFAMLGMPSDAILSLFQIGQMLSNKDAGTLFQFFDLSHQSPYQRSAYQLADTITYPAIKKGVPQSTGVTFSDLYQGTFKSGFLSQYRLVVNHAETLNPYASLSMRRYDLNDPAVVKEYERRLRDAIRKIPYNTADAAQFKKQLLALWKIDTLQK